MFYFSLELGITLAGHVTMEPQWNDRFRFHRSHTRACTMGPRKSAHTTTRPHSSFRLLHRYVNLLHKPINICHTTRNAFVNTPIWKHRLPQYCQVFHRCSSSELTVLIWFVMWICTSTFHKVIISTHIALVKHA